MKELEIHLQEKIENHLLKHPDLIDTLTTCYLNSTQKKHVYLIKQKTVVEYLIHKLDFLNDPDIIKLVSDAKEREASIRFYLDKIINKVRDGKSVDKMIDGIQPYLKESKFIVEDDAIVLTVIPKHYSIFMSKIFPSYLEDSNFSPFVIGGSNLLPIKRGKSWCTFILGSEDEYQKFIIKALNELKSDGGDYRLRGVSSPIFKSIKNSFRSLDENKIDDTKLSEIDILSSEKVESTLYFTSYLLSTIARREVNFIEVTSCYRTTILIVKTDKKDTIIKELKNMGMISA